MKNYILMVVSIVSLNVFAQKNEPVEQVSDKDWQMELLYTYDPLNTSYGDNYGFIFKAKRFKYQGDHIKLLYGLAYQNSYISETENLFTDHVDGFTRDIGLYAIFDLVYYPFARKKFYISFEPFAGVTHLKSIGKLRIQEHSVYETYVNNFAYFNYGVTQSLGFKIKDFTISGFGWLSLKGFLDGGRMRPADFDSRLFVGVGVGYAF
ncbi:hypothetical protein MQE36_08220 [Zhouia spongiae]|uniref:DUF3575 domain-containing protein n=1 Tax=Zhouia spongiae TaxID=2202721 RepID=A0ABY3YR46_9FLAO|nr:hypothetical protein [Zhouia spongiae]UNZ00311.1 hypothetical protein MQE36_08220 [Zhouia spongiae]